MLDLIAAVAATEPQRLARGGRMMKLLRSPEFTLAASAVAVAGVTALAYSRLGFLGVLIVGLVILFTSVQSELHKDGPRKLSVPDRSDRSESIAREAEGWGMARFWRWAKILGAVLTAAGLAGFALLQLP